MFKGVQVVLVYDFGWVCLCAYVHRHNSWDIPEGFILKGPNELRIIMENLGKMIIGEDHMVTGKTSKIFNKKPGLCWDNYFSGDNNFDHAGKKGCVILSTVRRYHIPKGVPSQYMHKNRTEPWNLSTKCSRFNEPIIMVQKEKSRDKQCIQ